MENENILVSVFCLAYNHENFIRQALDGFVMQKTNFNFEVLVHDDASTDNTPLIIKEYAQKYPGIIKPIFQTENQYSKKVRIIPSILFPKAKGKYLAWCEGDDYWFDENKLQFQIDSLERNSTCVACCTKVKNIKLDGTETGWYCGNISDKDTVVDKYRFVSYCLNPGPDIIMPLQISGFILKKDVYENYLVNPFEAKKYFSVGDLPLFLYTGMMGDIYYIQKPMSCYRIGNPNSWNGRHSDLKAFEKHYRKEIIALEKFDKETDFKYHNAVICAVRNRKFAICSRNHDLKGMKSKELIDLYKKQSLQRRITYHIYHYFPHLSEHLKKILKRIKN